MKKIILALLFTSVGYAQNKSDSYFEKINEERILEAIKYEYSLCPKCYLDSFKIFFVDFEIMVTLGNEEKIDYYINTWDNIKIKPKNLKENTNLKLTNFIKYKIIK